jgi:hypothetical protein
MDGAVTVFALLPGGNEYQGLNGDMLESYDQAVDDVHAGQWHDALTRLRTLPPTDGPTQFLLRMMAERNHQVPADWNGAFSLGEK